MVPGRGMARAQGSTGASTGSPTASGARFQGAGCPIAPSLSTIAPSLQRWPHGFAIGAIGDNGTDDTRTQHWPQLSAGTSAPWHTRTTMLPGSSTNGHWTSVPVSSPITNEDENGGATSTVSVTRVMCVRVHEDGSSDVAVSAVVCALVYHAMLPVHPLTAPPSTLPSFVTHRGIHPSHHHPSTPSAPVASPDMGVAAVSPRNIVGSMDLETAATSSSIIVSAVGLYCSNDHRGRVDVPANIAGSIDHGTPTAPPSAPAAVLRHLDVGASIDRCADVHDSVIASRGLDAWKPAPRLVLNVPSDAIVDATGTTLKRPGSDTHTSDARGNVYRAYSVARRPPSGVIAWAGGNMRAEDCAARNSDRMVAAFAIEGGASAVAHCKQDNHQYGDQASARPARASAPSAVAAGVGDLSRARRLGGAPPPRRQAGVGQAVADLRRPW